MFPWGVIRSVDPKEIIGQKKEIVGQISNIYFLNCLGCQYTPWVLILCGASFNLR